MPSGIIFTIYKVAGPFEDRIVRRRDIVSEYRNAVI